MKYSPRIRHAMLDCDATAQCFHALQVAVGNRLAMVEEPVQPFERHFAVHFLEHIQKTGDALVVGCMETERPFVGGQHETTSFNSPSSEAGRSGRGSRKSSKSAAEKTSISPAPLQRKKSSPLPGPVMLIQRAKSSFSCFGFCVKRLQAMRSVISPRLCNSSITA